MKKLMVTLGFAALLLAGCGIGNPWPTTPPPTTQHHTVLVIGDSIAGQADVTLPDILANASIDATVIDAHQNGSGLFGPVGDQPNALAYVTAMVTAWPQADTVLVEWIGACGVCGTESYPALGTRSFYDQWSATARTIIDYLHGAGKTVVWVVSPPIGASSATAASGSQIAVDSARVLTMLDTSTFAPAASAGKVNWWTALTDTSAAFQTVLFYDGQNHTVRSADLVHLTLDGSTRASTWTAFGLGVLWASLPPLPEIRIQQTQPRLIEAGDPVTLDVS